MDFQKMKYDPSSTASILKNLNYTCDTILRQYMHMNLFGLHTNEAGSYNLFSFPKENPEVSQATEKLFAVKKSTLRTAVTGMCKC